MLIDGTSHFKWQLQMPIRMEYEKSAQIRLYHMTRDNVYWFAWCLDKACRSKLLVALQQADVWGAHWPTDPGAHYIGSDAWQHAVQLPIRMTFAACLPPYLYISCQSIVSKKAYKKEKIRTIAVEVLISRKCVSAQWLWSGQQCQRWVVHVHRLTDTDTHMDEKTDRQKDGAKHIQLVYLIFLRNKDLCCKLIETIQH